jgi:hypothetical protein
MASLIACDGTWQQSPEGYLLCSGTLQIVPDQGLTTEEAVALKDAALGIFVVVFCFLALKKVATMR